MRRGWLLGAALGACAPASPAPVPPPPSAAPVATMAAGGAACATCHADIAREQASSFHALAFTDRTFQDSLALEEPREHAFCNGCHAPDGREAGVSCASCHGGDPHGAPARGARRVNADRSCATCHEFVFDERRPELVQKTVSEHAASAFASVSCTTCHMPARDGHRDHRFGSGHEPPRIRDALRVVVTRSARGVRVTIATSAGHAFPTGDMFRRARLQVFAEDRDGAIVADATRTFGRTWNVGGPIRTETSDTRIRGTWEDDVPLEAARAIVRIRWQIAYERIIAIRGTQEFKASSDVVAEGELAQ